MMNLYAKINTFIHNIHVCRQYFSAICMDNVFLTTQARHMACVWLVMKKSAGMISYLWEKAVILQRLPRKRA